MQKIAVVYWSGTGNTEAMANAVAEGARKAGAETELFASADFKPDMTADYGAIAWGCSAQGSEVLEEGEFEPLFAACEGALTDKKVALFGSYGWGDGEWMRDWEARCADKGIALAAASVICCDAPDDAAAEQCRALGAALAAALV